MAVQNRKMHMDILRIIAIFMIMFNHTGIVGFSLYTVCTEGILYWIYLFLAILIKSGVPIFLMISGALLLPKEESFSEIFKKRILKILFALMLGMFVHYLYFAKWQISEFSLKTYLRYLYSGEIVIQYWYLYTYLGYLFMLPISRIIAKHISTENLLYMVVVYFIMKCLPIGEFLLFDGEFSCSIYFSLFIMGDNVFFPLFGYLLEHRLPELYDKKKNIVFAGAAAVVAVLISCFLTYRYSICNQVWDEGSTQNFFQNLIFIPAGCIYFVTKYVVQHYHIPEKIQKMIIFFGSNTFGIYLFETLYRMETRGVYVMAEKYLPSLAASVVWMAAAFGAGIMGTWMLKKVPLIKKIL